MDRLIFILASVFIISCSSSVDKQVALQTVNSDTSVIEQQTSKTVIGFTKWYRDNMERLNKIELVNNAYNLPLDSTKFYSVNFENTETYLLELKKSNFISDNFVNLTREYFKKCNENLLANPQNDGPPDGFDFDLILLTQELDQDLSNIDKAKVWLIDSNDNYVKLKLIFFTGGSLIFTLSKYGDRWLVDKIEST